MAKRELFNVHPLVTRFLHGIGAFPINRGARDTAALEHSVKLLRDGLVLGMFPEGTRNRGLPLRRGRSGVARVALEADVPIVPVAVQGIPHLHSTWRNPFDRTHVSVQFGQPLRFEAGKYGEGAGVHSRSYDRNCTYDATRIARPIRRHYRAVTGTNSSAARRCSRLQTERRRRQRK